MSCVVSCRWTTCSPHLLHSPTEAHTDMEGGREGSERRASASSSNHANTKTRKRSTLFLLSSFFASDGKAMSSRKGRKQVQGFVVEPTNRVGYMPGQVVVLDPEDPSQAGLDDSVHQLWFG